MIAMVTSHIVLSFMVVIWWIWRTHLLFSRSWSSKPTTSFKFYIYIYLFMCMILLEYFMFMFICLLLLLLLILIT
ncbi:hypothetical protein J3Q64DRAFT_1756719 [Phycomyces blakesleeanus]|uniref:Uncharacterized protein n=1 Tax=Phycomyces blakesleeanus TaxID=4837 RepID=A0ABR3AS06_PHYBL